MSGKRLLSVLVLTRTLSGYTTVTSYVVLIRMLPGYTTVTSYEEHFLVD